MNMHLLASSFTQEEKREILIQYTYLRANPRKHESTMS